MQITPQTTFAELEAHPGIGPIVPYFCYPVYGTRVRPDQRLADAPMPDSPWGPAEVTDAAARLGEITEGGEKALYSVYPEEETAADPDKACVKLVYFPAPGSRRFVILCAGGAFQRVCSLWESMPVAAELNRRGVAVFCLTYRVNETPLFPKPLDDLAAAVAFVRAHADGFGLDADRYAVGGFSAGGYVAAAWGVPALGYEKYGQPKPEMLIPVYPLAMLAKTYENANGWRVAMFDMLFGPGHTQADADKYDVYTQVDENYPPAYFVHAKDDPGVPVENSVKMHEKLRKLGIPAGLDLAEHGSHGFGRGDLTDAAGWPGRMLEFWYEQNKKESGEYGGTSSVVITGT